jgi:hypothetical protein
MIPKNLPIRTLDDRNDIQKYLIKVIRNQLENTDPLANVNALVNTFNQAIDDPLKKLTPYTKITEFDNLISNAYTSGDTSMTDRDRLVLRAIAWPNMTFFELESLLGTYTAPDGKADFTDTILSETGKPIGELFKFTYVLLDIGFSPESIDYINSYIPSKYDPPFLRTNSDAVMTAMMNKTDRGKFLTKLLTIPCIYIRWLVENKWKLDLTWRPSICDPKLELPQDSIMFLPSKIIKGLGTYTKAELGNPTSYTGYGMLTIDFKDNTSHTIFLSRHKWEISEMCIRRTITHDISAGATWSSVTITASSGTSS